jgi:UDP-N-acetylglucosamine diphosphorylase / glucose-1-phosphate thymidylyltransferase / UDP-N-acetylgalactosamine diphosphorylase / glucosamine-1-phosphate N-acetyltransferase / galactosamine-1-phosphate N-acetyltransferase
MLVTQGVIPAAGSGTRLGPFTNAIPKELLPIGDKAVIEHVVESMKLAGITDIAIVVSPHKHGLSDYLGSGKRFGVRLTYVVQDERLGLANAVLSGEHVIKGSFAVVLGDNFFHPKSFLRDLISYHIKEGADATLGAANVNDVTRHGIIVPDDNKVINIIEKPSAKEAPSTLGAIGIYIFEHGIFDAIRETEPGIKNEYQLTDSVKIMIDKKMRVIYKKINGIHIDVGTPTDLMLANEWYLKRISQSSEKHIFPNSDLV